MAKSKPTPAPTPAPAAKGKAAPKAAAAKTPVKAAAAAPVAKTKGAAVKSTPPPPPPPAPKALTKSGIYQALADSTKLERKDVVAVFNELIALIKSQVGPGGPGVMKLPGLIKVTLVEKPARPAETRKDPFTGQMKDFPAKEASSEIKVRALKELKDLIKK